MSQRAKKLFTVEEANATLPLVRAIAGDLVKLSREVIERRQHIDVLTAGRNDEAGDLYADELTQSKQELDKDHGRLQEFARELSDLGVELKSGPDGLVDFPAEIDGRAIYLCWKHDEPEVLYWHEQDGGFDDRQSLTADSVAETGTDEPSDDNSLPD